MKRLALGLISGTSADGVSAALIEINEAAPGLPIKIIGRRTDPYPALLRRRVLEAINLKTPQLSRLNFELGEFFAQSALRLIRQPPSAELQGTLDPPLAGPRQSQISNFRSQIKVIGSHGQTIYHGPDDSPPNTLQIGEPAVIAERTGLPVAADFRPGDMAAGGQGAPLIGFFDWYCFHSRAPVILVNIGGIANITLVNKNPGQVIAFDTGPGNCLMDLAVSRATNGRLQYDQNGRLAGRGLIHENMIRKAIQETKFLKKQPPKSTGRELFNATYLERYFGKIKKIEDRLATLAGFTAQTLTDSLKKMGRPSSPIYCSGGGNQNQFLMNEIRKRRPGRTVTASDTLGLPSEAREAACFALLGYRALCGKFNQLPKTTGAQGKPRVLGKLIIP